MNNNKFSDITDNYKFTGNLQTGEKHSELSSLLCRYLTLKNKIIFVDGKIKIYPFTDNLVNIEKKYYEIIKSLQEKRAQTHQDMDFLLEEEIKKIENEMEEFKSKLKSSAMMPYYGNPKYMIGRAKYINECLKNIPNINVNIDSIVSDMEAIDNKYPVNNDFSYRHDKIYIDDSFFYDYDKLEDYYKNVLEIEKQYEPIVLNYWKQYLTDPNSHNESYYRYVMHTFTSGMVNPSEMRKACCSLNTNDLIVTPYGNCGLIYDIDIESLDTMCSEDVGSWVINKDLFFERECPNSWQYTNVEGETSIFYEYARNSKIIMPQIFEKETLSNNTLENGQIRTDGRSINYSEIFLNDKAKAKGVFYIDECQNVNEVASFAQKYELPLIHITQNYKMVF